MLDLIFEYQKYRIYLRERLRALPKHGHGAQAKMAQAIRCQDTYVSRVLQGEAHFNLEQGEAINRFLGHNQEESHFFLLLLQSERAGTPELRRYFDAQLEGVLQRRLVLKDRLKITNQLSDENKLRYYSQWYFSAIHIALTIPELQTRDSLIKYFSLPAHVISEALDLLISSGLATQEGLKYKPGSTRIHLGSDSPLIAKSHINWRLQAMRSLEQQNDSDLHYSSVVSISHDDVLKIKADLIKQIENTKAVVKASPEEELCCFALDFFKVT